MASALAKVDISDSAHLKTLLTETDSPLVSIKQFQKSNAIALESLAPALPLLDRVRKNYSFYSYFFRKF